MISVLAAAGVGAVLAVMLRQSVVLGFVVAGILLGPNTPGFVADVPAVEQLADVGVILLMFAIGVQLSFEELLRVWRVSVVGGLAQVTLSILLGLGAATLVGVGVVEALFFGAVISNSSSTVLVKVLDEHGAPDATHGRIALAWSSVQDLSTVLLVVLLTSMATGDQARMHMELGSALLQAAMFLGIIVPIGFWALPRLLERLAQLGNREAFVLIAIGIALVMAFISAQLGISVALGAFIAGILVSRSDLSHQVLGEIMPVRDVFAGMFFVSVGMFVDPRVVVDNWPAILVTVVLIIVGKFLLGTGFTLLAGYRGRTAATTGLLLAQSAEFSFLMAKLGTDLDAISDEMFSVLLTGAAVSIILAPTLYRLGVPLGALVERWLPETHPAEAAMPRRRLDQHVILCGYGRVGRIIERVLRSQDVPYVIIDQERHLISEARAEGLEAFAGSASNHAVLDLASLPTARCIVVAIPDPLSVRQIVTHARRVNPGIDIVARTHNNTERLFLERTGANEAVVGELELALEMSRHTLYRFGMSDTDAESVVQEVRGRSGLDGVRTETAPERYPDQGRPDPPAPK